jgi:hypothetical protein
MNFESDSPMAASIQNQANDNRRMERFKVRRSQKGVAFGTDHHSAQLSGAAD